MSRDIAMVAVFEAWATRGRMVLASQWGYHYHERAHNWIMQPLAIERALARGLTACAYCYRRAA